MKRGLRKLIEIYGPGLLLPKQTASYQSYQRWMMPADLLIYNESSISALIRWSQLCIISKKSPLVLGHHNI